MKKVVLSSFIFLLIAFLYFSSHSVSEAMLVGEIASEEEFKYVVSLGSCTGSILSAKLVLTAGYCFYEEFIHNIGDLSDIRVIAGRRNRFILEGIRRGVKKIMFPLGFARRQVISPEIAIVELDEPLDLQDTRLATVKLSNDSQNHAGGILHFAGFGAFQYIPDGEKFAGYHFDRCLRKANLTISESSFDPTKEIIYAKLIRPANVQTDNSNNSTKNNRLPGLCSGDAGGPLVRDDQTLVGIADFNLKHCNEQTRGTAFVNLNFYKDLINDAMNGNTARFQVRCKHQTDCQ